MAVRRIRDDATEQAAQEHAARDAAGLREHLHEMLKDLLWDEMDCAKRGQTSEALAIAAERRRIEKLMG